MDVTVYLDGNDRVHASRLDGDRGSYVTIRVETEDGALTLAAPDRTTLRHVLVEAMRAVSR